MKPISKIWRVLLHGLTRRKDKSMEKLFHRLHTTQKRKAEGWFKTKSTKALKRHYLATPFQHIYLTPQEKIALQHLSQGKTFVQTAALMEVHLRTIEYHVDRMKRKTGTKGRTELLNHAGIVQFIRDHFIHSTLQNNPYNKKPEKK